MTSVPINVPQAAREMTPPRDRTRDAIWLIVVIAFSLVLVGSFAALAAALFVGRAAGGVSPEVILSMFTGVVGFLAGLFAPSPVTKSGS